MVRTSRPSSAVAAALGRDSPRLATVRLILRQQQAGRPSVYRPVTEARPELARIAVSGTPDAVSVWGAGGGLLLMATPRSPRARIWPDLRALYLSTITSPGAPRPSTPPASVRPPANYLIQAGAPEGGQPPGEPRPTLYSGCPLSDAEDAGRRLVRGAAGLPTATRHCRSSTAASAARPPRSCSSAASARRRSIVHRPADGPVPTRLPGEGVLCPQARLVAPLMSSSATTWSHMPVDKTGTDPPFGFISQRYERRSLVVTTVGLGPPIRRHPRPKRQPRDRPEGCSRLLSNAAC